MGNYVNKNLGSKEEIIYECQVHWMPVVIPAILIPFTAGISILFMISPIINMLTTELAITNKKVIGKLGLISIEAMDTPLNKINNIIVQQSLFGRIFGYGTLQIHTSSSNYVFKYISNPNEVKRKINAQIEIYDEERIMNQAKKLVEANK